MSTVKLPYPSELTGDTPSDIQDLSDKVTRIVKELDFVLSNLDETNVTKAASVNAQNINTNTAKIQEAQIGNLTAEKITTGTLNTDLVTVGSKSGKLTITKSLVAMYDTSSNPRMLFGIDESNKFVFVIKDNSGEEDAIRLDSNGNIVLTGILKTGANSQDRIVIEGTGIVSYKKSGNVDLRHGICVNQLPYDFSIFYMDNPVFIATYTTNGTSLRTGASTDEEFLLVKNGNAYAKGTWNMSGANVTNIKDADGVHYATMTDIGSLQAQINDLQAQLSAL